jgi:hypothetical protein
MVHFLFIHDEYKTFLFEQELQFETLDGYVDWFIQTYPCLGDWKTHMEWSMHTNETSPTIEIHMETKLEGYPTICVRNTENENTLYIPFPSFMTFNQLRTIFSLLLPCIEFTIYLTYNETYYLPKHNYIYLPKKCTECTVNTSTYPLNIYMNYGLDGF